MSKYLGAVQELVEKKYDDEHYYYRKNMRLMNQFDERFEVRYDDRMPHEFAFDRIKNEEPESHFAESFFYWDIITWEITLAFILAFCWLVYCSFIYMIEWVFAWDELEEESDDEDEEFV